MKTTYFATIYDDKNIEVKDIDGCTNLGCISIVGDILYCIKTNSDNNKGYLCKYKGSGVSWSKLGEPIKINGNVHAANGMTYYKNPSNNDEALFVSCNTSTANRKIVKLSLSGTVLQSYSCGSAGRFGAISAYKNGKFFAMANDKNTPSRICIMVGVFNDDGNSFDVLDTYYVENSGYSVTQDIYYNESAGLFICTTEPGTCRSMILQVDFDGKFSPKPSTGQDYKAIDKIAVWKDNVELNNVKMYKTYQLESIDLDSQNRIVGVGNIVKNVTGAKNDSIQYIANITII